MRKRSWRRPQQFGPLLVCKPRSALIDGPLVGNRTSGSEKAYSVRLGFVTPES